MASTFPYARASGLPIDDFANISAWYARMELRPSWQAAVAPVLAFVSG